MTLPGPDEWPVDDVDLSPTTDLLRKRARSSPQATALVDADGDEAYSYGTFDDFVSERLAGFRTGTEADLSAGDRIGLLLETGLAFTELSFATARAGTTAVPLNVRLDRASLASQVERAALDALVCDSATEAAAVAVTPDSVPVVSVDEPGSSGASKIERGREAAARPSESHADSDRLIVFTSGTTGDPKGVRLTRSNLVASAVDSAHRLGVAPGDRWLVCLPMYHVGGLAPLVRSTLYGTTTVIQSSFDAAETASVVDEHAVTCVSLVPTMLKRLLEAGWTPPDHLRFVLLGGGPIPPSLVDRCEDRGVPVCPTYGATETASQVATARPETAFEHRGTVGRPLRRTTVTVVDESGALCDPGDVGELLVDGPTVTPGYLADAQTAAAFGEDGFQTGDVGYRDAAGRLWVVGRVDDQVVTGGENVQPATVAATIRDLHGVRDAIVVGVPDEEWGERVCALVEPTDPSLSATAVRDRCRRELAEYEVPRSIQCTDSLPRTPSGTVDRERVRSLFEGG